jgi:hypothetical protein
MSSSAAIATITAVMAKLLELGIKINDDGSTDTELTDLDVTTLPPGKARPGTKTANQVNIFLYHVLPNASVRNMDMPRTVKPGESAIPPLALDLQYLITAYGKGDDDRLAHRILGRGMRVLADFPLVGVSNLFDPTEISSLLSDSNIDHQPEHVRITQLPISMDELSKLWMMFQADYRISAAYQVSVVLIESLQPVRSTLPVLKRGASDRGASVSATRLPILTGAEFADSMPSMRLGTDVKILGKYLDVEGGRVRFTNMRLAAPIERTAVKTLSDSLIVHLGGLAEDSTAYTTWVPGFYTAALLIDVPGNPLLVTNEVPVSLAPTISISAHSAPAGDLTLTVTCTPRVHDDQTALLLFGDGQIAVLARNTPDDPALPTTFTFQIKNAKPGVHLVRLRIDGVDSLPFTITGTPPVIDFDPNQKVTIT